MAVVLPKYVTLYGDNERYLAAVWVEGYPYHQFNETDIGSDRISYEVFPTGDSVGSVQIKSVFHGRFWRRSPNWIWADSTSPSKDDPDTLFVPYRVDETTVALKCVANDRFLTRLTTEGKESCLNANATTINLWARLKLGEPVISRRVYDIVYRLDEAVHHESQPLFLGQQTASREGKIELPFHYSETQKRSWKSGVSFSTGVTFTITAGVPAVASQTISISSSVTDSTEWGNTIEQTISVDPVYRLTVPPDQTVTVRLEATQSTLDVPFSYVQQDILRDGSTVTRNLGDGVFQGTKFLNIRYISTTS